MSHIYRNKKDGELYTIELLVKDIKHTNNGINEGVYAYSYPYRGVRKGICHTREGFRTGKVGYYDPKRFVRQNFDVVGEMW